MTKAKPANRSGRPTPRQPQRKPPGQPTRPQRPASQRRPPWLPALIAAVVIAAIAILYFVFQSSNHNNSNGSGNGGNRFQVGSPGAGEAAPAFTLPSATGGTTSLASFRGKTVLLYFHEGLGCQPCWDQLRDLEKDPAAVKAAGVDDVVAITTGAPDLLAQKLKDDSLHTPTLADTDLAVSKTYQANMYGMMGEGRDGHSFILVGPDGKIEWRADYGGAPNYTMYVKPSQLFSDMKTRVQP